MPAEEHRGYRTQLTSLLPGGCGNSQYPCLRQPSPGNNALLPEGDQLPAEDSQVGGGCGDIGVHSLTGEKSISVPRILPELLELALEMLSNLEQGGYIQQGIFNVLPQPV